MQLRYPACLLAEAAISCCLAPQPVHLLGSSDDAVAAALAAGSLAAVLNHRREAAEMAAGDGEQDAAAGAPSSDAGSAAGSPRHGSAGRRPTAVCLVTAPGACSASPAAAATLCALRRRVPGLAAVTALSGQLLDDEWMALSQADILILDCPLAGSTAAAAHSSGAGAGAAPSPAAEEDEQAVAAARSRLADAGLLELAWQRFWVGSLLVGVGQGCALLGRGAPAAAAAAAPPPVLPWYCLRAGSAATGWASLHAALAGGSSGDLGVGVLVGGCWVAEPWRGQAEMLVAPSRGVLVGAAAWAARAGNQAEALGLEEAEEGFGFMCELALAGG